VVDEGTTLLPTYTGTKTLGEDTTIPTSSDAEQADTLPRTLTLREDSCLKDLLFSLILEDKPTQIRTGGEGMMSTTEEGKWECEEGEEDMGILVTRTEAEKDWEG